MSDHPFTTRMAILIAADMMLAVIDTYVPQTWTPIKACFALLELGAMAVTVIIAVARVLEDY
jgi:hypothetical protein